MDSENHTTPKISIVIPTYTRWDKLNDCLRSIFYYCDPATCSVVVVANGASPETGSVYNTFAGQWGGESELLWFDQPLGYPKSVNMGIKAARRNGAEYVVLLNDDAEFLEQPKNQCIDVMLKPILADQTVGLTGPLEEYDPNSDSRFLIFFCVMIRVAVFNSIGLLDEAFQYFGEDTDFCIKAQRAGWRMVRVPEEHPTELKPLDPNTTTLEPWKHDKVHSGMFRIWHDAESTIGYLPDSEIVLRESRAILQERYGKKEAEVNTPSGLCPKCNGPLLDGACVGAENKLNCNGLYLWRASVIDGWFGNDEGQWLAKQVKALPPSSKILSVGAWHGRSSRFIADNLSEGSQLWDVDSFLGSSGEPEMHGTAHWDRGDHAFQWYWCNLHEHIEKGRVVPVRMWSENAAHTLGHLIEKGQLDRFSLIFIDGDHSEEGIKNDVEAWLPFLKEGGLICGHDYYKESEGPQWVHVRQYVETKFPNVEKAATSIWYVRPSLNPHQAELDYQIQSQCDDPEYAAVVENALLTLLTKWFAITHIDTRILDVGCGDGVAIRILRGMGFRNVVGVDLIESPNSIKADMHDLPYAGNDFDVILSSHSLEHAYDPLKALSEFHRVLKPDGKLFLVLPYPDVIDSEHRAKAHCGSEALGLTINDNGKSLIRSVESAGFSNICSEQGNLRGEPEIYLKFDATRSHVYDCFIFSSELDLLEIRLNTLNDVVDRFVIVEGTQYHNGEPKPLFFDENKERFAPFLRKITHIVVDDWPEATGSVYDNAWMRERWQRDAILKGLADCKDSDIIILGDADEIASPEAIKNYDVSQGLCRLKQRLFYYYLNCENKEGWDWQKIVSYKMVKELTPCGIRYPPAGDTPLIESGGWHFSFLGDAHSIITKIHTYSHREFDTPEITDRERVEKLVNEGQDIFGRDLKYEFVGIDDSYPEYIKHNVGGLEDKGFIKPLTMLADYTNKAAATLATKKHWTVTAEISTKDRYFTTLSAAIVSVATQTRKPDKLKIYDDGEQLDLRSLAPYSGLLQMLTEIGIEWEVLKTPREGQVTNHQHCLDNADTDFIWRIDDDEIAMPNCLEVLVNTVRDYGNGGQFDKVGAVAGLVHHSGAVSPLPDFVDGSLRDIQAGVNMQWFDFNSYPREVQHLYSSFLVRVDAMRKSGGYPKTLSKIGHREESIATHQLYRAGYLLLVTPYAKTYHLRESTGGIRSFTDQSLWEHDEKVFQGYLAEWGAGGGKPTKLIVLDAGIGDHFAFKSILPKLREIHADKELVLSVCFPDVFEGENLKLISIADAKTILGERYEDSHAYKHFWEMDNKKQIREAMLEFWG